MSSPLWTRMSSKESRKLWRVWISTSRRIPSSRTGVPAKKDSTSQVRESGQAPQGEKRYVVLQLAFLAAVGMDAIEKCARKILQHQRLRQSAQRLFRKRQKTLGCELLPRRRANFGGAVGERQNHVTVSQPHALLVIDFTRDVSERQALQPFPQLQKLLLALAPEKHPRVRSVSKIKFTARAIECSRDDRRQPQRARRALI